MHLCGQACRRGCAGCAQVCTGGPWQHTQVEGGQAGARCHKRGGTLAAQCSGIAEPLGVKAQAEVLEAVPAGRRLGPGGVGLSFRCLMQQRVGQAAERAGRGARKCKRQRLEGWQGLPEARHVLYAAAGATLHEWGSAGISGHRLPYM